MNLCINFNILPIYKCQTTTASSLVGLVSVAVSVAVSVVIVGPVLGDDGADDGHPQTDIESPAHEALDVHPLGGLKLCVVPPDLIADPRVLESQGFELAL
jgi:hypothetical protein